MRLRGHLFLVVACAVAFVARPLEGQPPPQQSTSDKPPITTSDPDKPTRTTGVAPKPQDGKPVNGHEGKPPITHPHGEPPTIDPHPAHEGHDLRNAAIGTGAGFLAGLLIGHAMSGKDSPEKLLNDHGPQTPTTFCMSNFSILGFVKGNWPAVLDYQITRPGLYLLTVSSNNTAPFSYLLDGSKIGRQQIILRLPARFGPEPKPGSYSIQAMSNAPGEAMPAYLRVFGLGAGERAVGSVAIDQLQFSPPALRPQDRQNALYGFHSHADFEKVSAEFERVGLVDGSVVTELEDQQDVKAVVRRNTEVANQQWDPRKRKARPGQHMLQVRAWYTLKSGGDWVVAWSPQLVRIEE